jgi:hypothetical protein
VDDAAGAGGDAARVLSARAAAWPRLGAIAAAVGLPQASGSLGGELLNAFLGCVLVYAALFGVGEMLLRSAVRGGLLLVVSALAAAAIARNLDLEARRDSATRRAAAS